MEGAALIDEIQRGGISRHDSLLLNTHIAISHSLLEGHRHFLYDRQLDWFGC